MGSSACCSFSNAEEMKIETLNHPLSSKRLQNDSEDAVVMNEIVIPDLEHDLQNMKTSNDEDFIIVQKRINLQKAIVKYKGNEKMLLTLKKKNLNEKEFWTFTEKLKKTEFDKICLPEEIWEDDSSFHIITQVPNGHPLFEAYLKSEDLSEFCVIGYIKEIISAFTQHTDLISYLNPEEVYFDENLNIKINPFAQTSKLFQPLDNANDQVKIKSKSWTLGIVIYSMLCGKSPYKSEQDSATKNLFSFANKHWDFISIQAKNLIMKLLSVNPEKRPNFQDILKDSWVTGKVNKKNNSKLRKDLKVFVDKLNTECAKKDLIEYFSSFCQNVEDRGRVIEIDLTDAGKGFNSKEAARVEKRVVLTQLILNYLGDNTNLYPETAYEILDDLGYEYGSDVFDNEISVGDFADFLLNLLDT